MPSLRVVQTDHHQLGDILLFGEGWAADSVRLTIDGKDFLRISAFTGAVSGSTVQPLDGRFLLLAWLPASTAGDVSIEAHETAGQGRTETAALRLPPASAWPLPPPSRDPAAQLRDFDQQRGRDRNPGSRLQAVRDVQAARSKQQRGPRGAANWTPVGPQTIWNGPTLATFPPSPRAGETSPVSGRVTALAVDPISPSTIYAGAAQGGIWKSTDRGVTWDAKSDFEVSLAIGSLVAVKRTVNGVDSTRLYVGTGEANFVDDSYYGAGLLRSDDGGKTWTSLAASVFERCHIGAIVVDPGNGNADHLFTGSNKGLAESTDSGASWTFHPLGGTQSYTVTGLALATINNKLQVLAGIYGGVVGVFDVSSSSWTTLTREGAGVTTRITLAAAPADPQTVYAAFGSPGPIYGIYKTPDFGNAWQQVSVPQGTKNSTYGLTLAVDPGDSNIVMLGEIGMWRSVNGCNNWTDVSLGTSATANVALHVDQHAIAFDSTTTPSRVYVGNDGGVWRSDDGCANWVSLNKGMQITQFNSMDTSGPAVMLAGSQDNGSMGWFGNPAFTLLVPGDGGQVYAAHQELTSNWLAARAKDQSLGLYASADFGLNWNFMGMNGLDPKTETFGFYPPFAVLPDGYCIGGQHLFYQTQPGQPWATISPDLTKHWSYTTPGYISTIRLLKPPPHDPRASRLLVGTSNGLLWTVDQVLGQPVWHAQGNYLRDNTNPVRAISPEGLFIPGFGRSREFVVTGGFSGPHVFRNDGEWNFVVVPTPIPDTNPVNCIEMPFARVRRTRVKSFSAATWASTGPTTAPRPGPSGTRACRTSRWSACAGPTTDRAAESCAPSPTGAASGNGRSTPSVRRPWISTCGTAISTTAGCRSAPPQFRSRAVRCGSWADTAMNTRASSPRT